jgi:predicted amidohydrolase
MISLTYFSSSAGSKLRMAMIQLAVGADKGLNIDRAVGWIRKAHDAGAKVVVLPEVFNSPFGNEYFAKYAEPIPGPSTE